MWFDIITVVWNLWFHAVFRSLDNFLRLHLSGVIIWTGSWNSGDHVKTQTRRCLGNSDIKGLLRMENGQLLCKCPFNSTWLESVTSGGKCLDIVEQTHSQIHWDVWKNRFKNTISSVCSQSISNILWAQECNGIVNKRIHLATFLSKTTNQEPAGDLEEESHFLSKNRPDVHRRLRWLDGWKRVFPNYGRRIIDHGFRTKWPGQTLHVQNHQPLTQLPWQQNSWQCACVNNWTIQLVTGMASETICLDSLQALATRAAIFHAAWLDGFHRWQLSPRFHRCYTC